MAARIYRNMIPSQFVENAGTANDRNGKLGSTALPVPMANNLLADQNGSFARRQCQWCRTKTRCTGCLAAWPATIGSQEISYGWRHSMLVFRDCPDTPMYLE